MEALREITKWEGNTPNHIYLIDGEKALGYIKQDTPTPIMFRVPMRFDKRYRKFETLVDNPFPIKDNSLVKKVAGSNGQVYSVNVDKGTCTCAGFRFRGDCKHVHG
jgi:hypothetical protein